MVLLLMLVAIALSPFLLTLQLTLIAHSLYRNRLWLLRDKVTDDLRKGVVRSTPTAERVRSLIERQIQVAGRHTLADSLLAVSIFSVDGGTSVFEEIIQSAPSDGTPARDREILIGYLREFRSATIRHLRWGSVFGWFAFPFFRAVSRLDLWLRRLTKSVSERELHKWVPLQRRARTAYPRPSESTGDPATFGASPQRNRVEWTAQQITRKLERAEVEIMPAATPSRHARKGARRPELADAGV
ncbi:hypothetical protein ACFFWC_25945 [Plantactinospora siamensis]|uniref:DUF4760 domain-containing protein n=1 Tax=Plantactinospora siamensis TaxID=555372 RepID=A0ABV6P5X3_9ACTN